MRKLLNRRLTRRELIFIGVLFCVGLVIGLLATLDIEAREVESEWRITIRAYPDHTFDAVFPFHGGLAGVEFFTHPEDPSSIHTLGYINPYGEVVIPIAYPHPGPWYTYRGAPHFTYTAAAIFSLGDNWPYGEDGGVAIFDSSGQQLTDFIFGDARNFSEGLVAVRNNLGWDEWRWGFADTSGEVVIPMRWEHAGDFVNGLAPVAIDGSWVLIDRSGDIVTHLNMDVTWPVVGDVHIPDFTYGVSRVFSVDEYRSDIMAVLDTDGNVVVPFGRYTAIWPFSQGLAAVQIGYWACGIFGFIDTAGESVIPPNPDWMQAREFSEGLAAVRVVGSREVNQWGYEVRQGDWGFIDTQGEMVISATFAEVRQFRDGLAAVRVGDWGTDTWGIIDTAGNWVFEPQYTQVSDFSEGLIWLGLGVPGDMQWSIAAVERVRAESNMRHGLIDRIMRRLRRYS